MSEIDQNARIKELEAQLAEAQEVARIANAKAEGSGAPVVIEGEYKGYRFADGHKAVRNESGELCDTAALLAAAKNKNADGHEVAVALLDRLIEMNYAYFTKKK